ncbi:MAG TPA: DUF2076 domain-containing protein [Acidobacteriaceae bacterium]|nr:DUF2076 domain-containing protein [Acidobacteriaceae bacterium]
MTPQEAQMLQDLVRKVHETQLTEKDPDAESLLADGLARDPDALYKLAQTVLVQNLALHQARAQIDQLRQQPVAAAPPPARASSFLGSLLGHREPPPPPPPSPVAPPLQYAPPPPPSYYDPGPGGAGGFLRSAATTAAGVAAGALAFQGIESLMHGFGHGPGLGGFGYGEQGIPMTGAPAEETIINNYYDDPASSRQESGAAYPGQGSDLDMQPQGPLDTSAGLDDDAHFDDASDDTGSDLGGEYDDQPLDDSSFDDGGDTSLV